MQNKKGKLFVHDIYSSPLSGEDIEVLSFNTIDKEVNNHRFSKSEWEIARRMIHTCGDPSIVEDLQFSDNAVTAGVGALKNGSVIYVDSQMIRAGLSLARLKTASDSYSTGKIICHIADEDVRMEAAGAGLPRSLFAVKKAKDLLSGAIIVFGNAPVALLELNRLIVEESVLPSLVIGMPVGFVHVVESKEELVSLNVPFIVLKGRRGGSTMAVSVIHALCTLASSSDFKSSVSERR